MRDIVREPQGHAGADPARTSRCRRRAPARERLRRPVRRHPRRQAHALGHYEDATWSPRGLFVVATRAHARRARPGGRRPSAGSCEPGGAVSLPRWAPDGLHVAYRAGRALRIVYGNGEHDVLAGRDMAAVAPAWRPGAPRTVAWAASDGTVTVEDADTAKVLRTYRSGGVHHLAWSGDGRKLLIAGRRHGTIRDFVTGRDHPPRCRGRRAARRRLRRRQPSRARRAQRRADRDPRPRRRPSPPTAASTISSGRPTPAGCCAGDRATPARARASGRSPTSPGARQVSAVTVAPRFGSGARTHGWCCCRLVSAAR